MTNSKKHTKRALLSSALSLLLCITMLIGTTWAWFTDSVTSAGNIIKSGTLDVEMSWADGKENPDSATWKDASTGAIFDYDLWEPGYVDVKHVKIANVGTLAFKYQIAIKANGELETNANGHTLADAIDVYYLENAARVTDRTELVEGAKLGTLAQFLENNANPATNTATGKLYPKDNKDGNPDNHTVTIALKMREDAGNEYQNMSIGTDFSVQLLATQWTYEEDTFDDQYDALADETPDNEGWPITVSSATVKDPTQPLVITAGDVTITVPAGVAAADDKYELVVENVSTELNFETGYTDATIEITLKKNGTSVVAEAGVSYDVEVKIADTTAVNSVTHNGSAVTPFAFADGKLTFATDSFSPFVISYLDKDTYIFPYDSEKTAAENGRALASYLNASSCKKNVFISAGEYTTNTQITFDGRSVNIIGLGDVTINKGHEQHLFTLQDQYNPNSDVEFNLRNLTLDGGNKKRNTLNVKYNVTVNLEDVVIQNAGWADILLDNANKFNDGNYYNDTRTVVNAKNVKVGKVSMDALPCTSTTADYTTYAEFNYDSDSTVSNIERQTINLGTDNLLVNGSPLLGNVTSVSTVADLKSNVVNAKEGDTIVLEDDITVTDKWDERNDGKTSKSITIDGNGHTLKLTGAVNDGSNYFSVYRFEGPVVVKNLIFDLSEAQGTSNRIRAISAKSDLTVDNCTFIGNPSITNSRAVIFGEGQSAAQVNASVSITNCAFTNWRRGISDNENAKDFKSVEIENNTFNNAGVGVSAYENIAFVSNEMSNGSWVQITSYSAKDTIAVTATGNTLDSVQSDNNWIYVAANNANITAQDDLAVEYPEG